MTNSLSNFKKQIWDRRIQLDLNKSLVALPLARFGFSEVTGATRFHRPAKSRLYSVSYTAENPMNTQPLGSTDEYLDVDQTRAVHFYIDDTQNIESAYNIYNMYAPEAVYALRNEMDWKFFAQVVNAFHTCGKLDIEWSGTNAQWATITTSNIVKSLSILKATLVRNNVETTTPFFVVLEPMIAALWEQMLTGTHNNVWDTTLRNGYLTTLPALWLDVYVSNNVYHKTVLTSTKNLAANDTLVIWPITIKLVASPSNANDVDLGANEAATLENIAKFINGTGTAGTDYIECTQENRAYLSQNLVRATATSHTITIETAWYVDIAEWTDSGTAYSLWETDAMMMCGQKGCVDMVIQKSVVSETQRGTSKWLIGTYVTTWTKYWIKTFNEGKQRMVALLAKMK